MSEWTLIKQIPDVPPRTNDHILLPELHSDPGFLNPDQKLFISIHSMESLLFQGDWQVSISTSMFLPDGVL